MKSYETVSEAINDLAQRGYTTDFNIVTERECLVCNKNLIALSPEEFEIDEVHRFEGMTDPGDEMIVFAVSAKTLAAKGILVNAYGIYEDDQTSKLIQYLSNHLKA
ncbi:phosphoribosylpyrophosphate synthetase [Paraflavitalea sp. CAU 1676]|uniref:phosphoribosylpyrophosphate synthetase n=1 Tax=Paraflavitalea sp. CAU 1676 TaxID=3032598 RepID=UPI0023DBA67F|nr:phosphoribosylpyrophosphate synthetase [Paraflavitalea sp. CAU 1676]MDF2191664.1 phosphoribosylpyrophosphate synthetase [Paraflavitalea sp. CAU 1676]